MATFDFNLEIFLAIAITFLVLNLLFIGFYIVKVLRELSNTVNKAGKIIDEVDASVKDGIGKANALEKPLQALATTSVALSGVMRGAGAMKRTTQSILGNSDSSNGNGNGTGAGTSATFEGKTENGEFQVNVDAGYQKKPKKKPKLFKRGK